MSTIIEKGTKVYKCNICGCRFTIQNADVKHKIVNSSMFDELLFGDTNNGYEYVLCPQCGCEVKVGYGYGEEEDKTF